MDKIKIAKGDWLLVCDGAKALLLENVGDAVKPKLSTRDVANEPHAPTREQGASPPGRVHQSVGQSRSSVEQTDWQDMAETRFLQTWAQNIEAQIAQHKVKRMHVVAPPRALGVLREAYGPGLKGVLGSEVAKDLVSTPIPDIERLLSG